MRRGFFTTLILGLIGLGILISLGLWQKGRIPQKAAAIAKIEAMINDAPVELPDWPEPQHDAYLPVKLHGTFGEAELHVLVSSRDYGAGFRIIAPFTADTGRIVMVDRGYVPTAAKLAERPKGTIEVIGNLQWPDERDRFIPQDDPDTNYWYARDVVKMAAALQVEPVLIVARESTGAGILPMPTTVASIPNNHFSYMVQWFLFAAVWFGMTSLLLWRMRSKRG
ncbi:SURF1 family protein [Celeribacter sp.]|uniref:SURF1 family protein n=1 Tax=Celeribacter sp. TaxID=1890673 RepID=UPI003A9419A6